MVKYNALDFDVKIRELSQSDLESICQLPQNEREIFFFAPKLAPTLTRDCLAEEFRNREGNTIMEVDGQVIGFANLYDVVPGQEAWIGNLIIHPSYRGRGRGKALVEAMVAKAVELYQIGEIKLSCFESNEAALQFYKRLGFAIFAQEARKDPWGKAQFLLHMGRALP